MLKFVFNWIKARPVKPVEFNLNSVFISKYSMAHVDVVVELWAKHFFYEVHHRRNIGDFIVVGRHLDGTEPQTIFVATHNTKVIGFIGLTPPETNDGEAPIHAIAVHRGKGVASKLFNHAVENLKRNPATQFISINDDSPQGQTARMALKAGFERVSLETYALFVDHSSSPIIAAKQFDAPEARVRVKVAMVDGKAVVRFAKELFVKRPPKNVDTAAVIRALEFGFNEQIDSLVAWMGDQSEREFAFVFHGRAGPMTEIKNGVMYLSYHAVRAPPAGTLASNLAKALKIILYQAVRHLLHPKESAATVQQHTITLLKAQPKLLEAYLAIVGSDTKNGIPTNPRWLYILDSIQQGRLQEFVHIIPAGSAEIFGSIQEEFNNRMRFDWNIKKVILDGQVQEGRVLLKYHDDHIRGLKEQIAGRQYLYIPHSNFYFVPWFVMFKDGTIYHRDDEFNKQGLSIHDGKERIYTSLVAYKDGRISIERLRFIKGIGSRKDRLEVVLPTQNMDITEEARLAFFGQQILKMAGLFRWLKSTMNSAIEDMSRGRISTVSWAFLKRVMLSSPPWAVTATIRKKVSCRTKRLNSSDRRAPIKPSCLPTAAM